MPSDLKFRLRPRIPVRTLACDAAEVAREGLLRATGNAGLEPSTVVDVAEALTGRPWACLGIREITTVARELLTVANRVARPSRGAHTCAS
jgi:hypothetical protein